MFYLNLQQKIDNNFSRRWLSFRFRYWANECLYFLAKTGINMKHGTPYLPSVFLSLKRMIYNNNYIHSNCIRMISKYIRMPSNCICMLLKTICMLSKQTCILAKCNGILCFYIIEIYYYAPSMHSHSLKTHSYTVKKHLYIFNVYSYIILHSYAF